MHMDPCRTIQFLQVIQDMKDCALEARNEQRVGPNGRKRKAITGPNFTSTIDLGRTVNRAPYNTVYPFQVSGEWRIQYFTEALQLNEKQGDPYGFGNNQ